MKTAKPVIGITVECHHDPEDARTRGNLTLNWNYAEAVALAGGVPLVVPPMADPEAIASIIDGWLIPGGDDIDASNFGEENHPRVELQDPERFRCEAALFKILDPRVPVLGICYGCQFLNVVRGGTLFQHLPDVPRTEVHTGGVLQTYKVDRDSKLGELLGEDKATGKSYHHQAVNKLAENLTVTAVGDDGTVEAIEASDRPWMIGVQWHPERTMENHDSDTLFKNFIEAARAYSQSKSHD